MYRCDLHSPGYTSMQYTHIHIHTIHIQNVNYFLIVFLTTHTARNVFETYVSTRNCIFITSFNMFPLFFIYLFFFMYFLTFLIFLTVHTGGQILNERDPIQITTIIIIIYTIDELLGFKCLTVMIRSRVTHIFGKFL